jgi:hypothetical protein
MNVWHICDLVCQSISVAQACDDTHIQHGRIVDVHSLLRVRRTVFVVEVDARIVNEHVYASVLRDLFRKVPDTTAV